MDRSDDGGRHPEAVLAALTDPEACARWAALGAHGPVVGDVDYELAPAERGSEVTASVSVNRIAREAAT